MGGLANLSMKFYSSTFWPYDCVELMGKITTHPSNLLKCSSYILRVEFVFVVLELCPIKLRNMLLKQSVLLCYSNRAYSNCIAVHAPKILNLNFLSCAY